MNRYDLVSSEADISYFSPGFAQAVLYWGCSAFIFRLLITSLLVLNTLKAIIVLVEIRMTSSLEPHSIDSVVAVHSLYSMHDEASSLSI
jgi:hypothetical protein